MRPVLRFMIAALLAMTLCGGLSPARADGPSTGELMLAKLFGNAPVTADMFTPGFLAQASITQILSVFDRLRPIVGQPQSIEQRGGSYLVHGTTFTVPVEMSLDPSGRVASLLLHTPVRNFATLDDVVQALGALPGKVSYLVTRNDAVMRARDNDLPIAVSSGFKLGVLAAVKAEIDAGHLSWDGVVKLTPEARSLAPGQLQDFPPGSPVTVHTLAALMVAQSDNTATDALINLIGRDKVAAALGVDFVLMTAEFYKLKADPALKLRYATADLAGRRKIASELANMPLPAAADAGGLLDPGVEWYLPASKLCQLAESVADLDVFAINPGLASRDDWQGIAFKGGSEVGVASLTTVLTDKAGVRYCASLTVNDSKPLDEDHLQSLYGSLIEKLAS